MYIIRPKKKTSTKIHTSILLIEGYREQDKVKHRTLANLTHWPEPLVLEFEKLLKGGKVTSLEDLTYSQGKSCGGLIAIKQLCKRLGISDSLGNSKYATLSLFMIAGRILSPGTSKLGLIEWSKNQAVEEVLNLQNVNKNNLYESLDWLTENQEEIEKKLFKFRNKEEKVPEVYFYDVTSSYFEGTQNELSFFGYNRDKKAGKKQIVIGLLCEKGGCPISVEVFNGNTQDQKTVSNQLRKLKNIFGVERVIFVGDKGMIKMDQINEINSDDFKWNYITSITKQQIEKMLKDKMLQMEQFDEKIAEIEDTETGVRYILKRNPKRAAEIRSNRESKQDKIFEKIEEKNKYLKEHKRASPNVALRDINQLVKKLKLSDVITCQCDGRTINHVIDKTELEELEKLDGCYVIKTDVPKDIADKEIVHDRYKDLSKVEWAFRTFKTAFEELRPIFVRKEKRTKGHVFICMLGYIILHHVWNRLGDLGLTRKFIFESLDKIQYATYHFEDIKIKKLPIEFLNHQQKILERLQVVLPKTM